MIRMVVMLDTYPDLRKEKRDSRHATIAGGSPRRCVASARRVRSTHT